LNCWICGNVADSEEHKFKASLLKRSFGKKYGPKNPHVFIQGEVYTYLENYKSKALKFPKVICTRCNNTLTKPHDNAFDIFVEYSIKNYKLLIENGTINFELIYGNDWQVQSNNFYKYIAKHMGCKIVTGNKPFDITDLSSYIKNDYLTPKLYITFDLKEGIHNTMMEFDLQYPHLYNSTTFYHNINQREFFGGWITIKSLSVVWIYANNFELNNNRMYKESKHKLKISYQKDFDLQKKFIDPLKLINFYEYGGEESLENLNRYFSGILGNLES
jgi:hypothetical protein